MWRTLYHLGHVLLLCGNLIPALPATCGATIGDNVNGNLEHLEPVLLLLGREGEPHTTVYTLAPLIHIPQRRTVGIVRCMLCQVRLDRTLRHIAHAILVVFLRHRRRQRGRGLSALWHLTKKVSDAPEAAAPQLK